MKITADQLESFIKTVVEANPAPINQANVPCLVNGWKKFLELGIGQAFGSFSSEGPNAFLLALYSTDLINGVESALCYLWMAAPNSTTEAMDLFREWENDPRTLACPQKIAGCVEVSRPEAMVRLYRRMGWSLHSQSFIKK